MKNTATFTTTLAASLCFFGCGAQDNTSDSPRTPKPQPTSSEWKSSHHPLRITWNGDWRQSSEAGTKDTETDTVAMFFESQSQCGVVVRITPDVPREQVSDQTLWDVQKKQYLSSGSSAVLVDEGPASLYDKEYYRIRFLQMGNKGRMCNNIYNLRSGARFVSITLLFPYDEGMVKDNRLPDSFSRLRVTLDEMNSR